MIKCLLFIELSVRNRLTEKYRGSEYDILKRYQVPVSEVYKVFSLNYKPALT